MNKQLLLWLAGLWLAVGLAQSPAETPTPTPASATPPTPLYRAELPEAVLCQVAIARPGLEQMAKAGQLPQGLPPLEVERSVTRSGGMTTVVQKFSDGKSSAAYYRDGRVLLLNTRGNPEIHTPGGETWEADFSKTTFPELSWVKAESYKGSKDDGGQTYHHYEGQGADGQMYQLLVHEESLLPIRLESPHVRMLYRYRRTAGAPPELPEALAEAWAIYLKNSGQPASE